MLKKVLANSGLSNMVFVEHGEIKFDYKRRDIDKEIVPK
jgi:hypothetical protein